MKERKTFSRRDFFKKARIVTVGLAVAVGGGYGYLDLKRENKDLKERLANHERPLSEKEKELFSSLLALGLYNNIALGFVNTDLQQVGKRVDIEIDHIGSWHKRDRDALIKEFRELLAFVGDPEDLALRSGQWFKDMMDRGVVRIKQANEPSVCRE